MAGAGCAAVPAASAPEKSPSLKSPSLKTAWRAGSNCSRCASAAPQVLTQSGANSSSLSSEEVAIRIEHHQSITCAHRGRGVHAVQDCGSRRALGRSGIAICGQSANGAARGGNRRRVVSLGSRPMSQRCARAGAATPTLPTARLPGGTHSSRGCWEPGDPEPGDPKPGPFEYWRRVQHAPGRGCCEGRRDAVEDLYAARMRCACTPAPAAQQRLMVWPKLHKMTLGTCFL